MDLNLNIALSETVFAQEVDGEMVLLDMDSENYFSLDEVGCAIWQAMQENQSLQSVYDVMLDSYEVETEKLKTDLLNFVGELKEVGLIATTV